MKYIVAVLMFTLMACASSKKAPEPPPVETKPPAPANNVGTPTSEPALKPLTEYEQAAVAAKAGPQEAHKEELKRSTKKSVDPKQSLLWLEHGNKRFVRGRLRKDGQSRKDIARLVSSQHPHAIVLSCSDSRVPPELVFDQKLGEIFVVRTAGEALDSSTIASIEYGIVNLGAKLIVVMGHTYCGAINAAIQTMGGGDAGSESLNHLVADIRPRLTKALGKGKPSEDAASESWSNAQGIAEDLKSRSALIRDAVEHDGVVIQPAMYYVNSGEVKFE